jgi:hypothetical protein
MHLDDYTPIEMLAIGHLDYEEECESNQLVGSKQPELQIGQLV